MNFLINSYAWSPAIVSVLSLGWVLLRFPYFKSNPKILIYLGVFVIGYFLFNLYTTQHIVNAADCPRPLAIATGGCTLLGQDVTSSLQTFLVVPWFGIGIVPLGGGLLITGIVLLSGWLTVLKVFGLLCLAYVLFSAYKQVKSPTMPATGPDSETPAQVIDPN